MEELQQILGRLDALRERLGGLYRMQRSAADEVARRQREVQEKQRYLDDKRRSGDAMSFDEDQVRFGESNLQDAQRRQLDASREISRLMGDIAEGERQLAEAQSKHYARQDELQRRLQEQLAERETELRSRSGPGPADPQAKYDLFISHATEDKADLVRPLANALQERGVVVWYDEFQLRIGDSLRRSIDQGLSNSRYGVVVLSTAFFAKNWPQYELDGLVTRENTGHKVILPIWHRVTRDEVVSFSPTLADKVALNSSLESVDQIADRLAALLVDD